MSFLSLLCHAAQVQVCERTNEGGRISETWTVRTTIPCRFARSSSTTTAVVAGAVEDRVDAVIFTGPELLPAIETAVYPVRFTTTDSGWSGTYELRSPPRIYNQKTSAVHHCECDCRKVQP